MRDPYLNIASRAARAASRIIIQAANRNSIEIKPKGTADFATQVDQQSETIIRETILKSYPDHCILGEEFGHDGNPSSDYVWIIDPIDGTRNFIRGIPHYCISIALQYRGRIEHALLLDPLRDEEFTATKSVGAWLNGKRIRVSVPSSDSLLPHIISTSHPYGIPSIDERQKFLHVIDTLTRQYNGIRQTGSAALDLAYVAAGRFDGAIYIGLKPWDIAAGILLVTEAGGMISDLDGDDTFLETGNITAGSKSVLKSILRTTKSACLSL